MSDLDSESLARILRETFLPQSDYGQSDFVEELAEAQAFGLIGEADLRSLLRKHREAILEIDRSPIDAYHQQLYQREHGEAWLNERLGKKFWFALSALLRLALELEFGEAYQDFANRRDGAD